MTQLNITINLENLKEKIEESSLESPVKACLSLMLNSLMVKERDEYIDAMTWRSYCCSTFNIALGRLIDNPISFPIQLSLVRDILIQTYYN